MAHTAPTTDVLTERFTVEVRRPSGWLVTASYADQDLALQAYLSHPETDIRVYDQETNEVVANSPLDVPLLAKIIANVNA